MAFRRHYASHLKTKNPCRSHVNQKEKTGGNGSGESVLLEANSCYCDITKHDCCVQENSPHAEGWVGQLVSWLVCWPSDTRRKIWHTPLSYRHHLQYC